MNSNEYSKVQEALNQILSNKNASFDVKDTSEESLINMINNMNKNDVITKLNSMGLTFISEKIKHTSNEELVKMLKNNPQILNKLNNFIK